MNSKHKNTWKARTERGFGQLGLFISRHPLLWFLACFVLIAALASQMAHMRKDTSVEGFLDEGSDAINRLNYFREYFGRDDVFIISIGVEDMFDPTFIENLRKMHQQIEEEVPYVNRVDSLANARHTYGENDTLIIEDLLPETLPEDSAEMEALKTYAYNNKTYRNYLISEDRTMTTIVVALDPFMYTKQPDGSLERSYLEDAQLQEALRQLYRIADEYTGILSDDIQLVGSMPISLMLGRIMERDFTVFTGLAIVIISSILFYIFRRASGVFMPIIVMLLGIVSTMSLMALFDTPMQVSTSILPSFLLAVCIGDSIHLLTIFYRHYDLGDEKNHALQKALEHTGLPIFFTSITTAAGLASFATSEITAIAALGIYGAAGAMIAFTLTVFILPCLVALLPLKRKPVRKTRDGKLQQAIRHCAHFSIRYAKPIVATSFILLFVGLYFVSKLSFSHLPLDWLPKDEPAYQALKHHEEKMGGSLAIEIILDTGKDRGVTNAAFMQALDEAMEEIQTWQTDTYRVVKVLSVADVVKESNRALHDNDDAYYSIPDDSDLISQELFLVEMDKPEDLYNLISNDYRLARLTILIPWIDALYYKPLLQRLDTYLNEKLGPHTEKIIQSGIVSVLGATFAEMLYSTAESYLLAGIVISIMMVLLIGNLKLGLLSMMPSLLPIVIVLAILELIGFPLDMLTMLIGSIAIGLTVDDNVHFMHGFRRLYTKTGDPAYAIEQTLLTSGRAMLITSIVLSLGFLVYTFSKMTNMVSFGLMTALCIVLALIGTFVLAPALMTLFNKQYHQQTPLPAEKPEIPAES